MNKSCPEIHREAGDAIICVVADHHAEHLGVELSLVAYGVTEALRAGDGDLEHARHAVGRGVPGWTHQPVVGLF